MRDQAEITLKAVLLAIGLSILLSAANAYLGLFAGMTISASIPAAVISMAVLRWFRRSNILENNIVQTGASAGESLAAGAIFTLPALVILGSWAGFSYWEVTILAGFGGLLGVLFSIPLRRAFIIETPLQFPEGVATAEVLKTGQGASGAVKHILWGGVLSGIYKLGETGLRFWPGVAEGARSIGGAILYAGINLSPALLAVGFIVGFNVAVLVFIGGALNWFVAIPLLSAWRGAAGEGNAVEAAYRLWSGETRYLGVGAMLIGGVWTLFQVRRSVIAGVRSGLEAYRKMRRGIHPEVDGLERDIPMQWISVALVGSVLPLYLIFDYITASPGVSAVMAILMLLAGFLFSAVAAYMSGVVGSSNNPISGVTIATVLTSSLLLVSLLGPDSAVGPAAAILIGAVVCCAAAISGDNMQDLKAGRIVGATPYRQQIMQGIGVVAAALMIAPILGLLLEAYGIGVPTEARPHSLPAPQATLMASIARGVFHNDLPLSMLLGGLVIGGGVILLDSAARRSAWPFRFPVLALAVGLYLPLQLSVTIALGGVIAWSVRRTGTPGLRNGTLFSAGLITGEALVGVLIAVLIVSSGAADPFALDGSTIGTLAGGMLILFIIFLLYKISSTGIPVRTD